MLNQQFTNTAPIPQINNNTNALDISDWRVLIVDDILDNIAIAKIVLAAKGAEVETAEDGREALETVETFKPNLILSDLSMPEMSGWEMLKHLRQSEETASIPVIALTAHALLGDEGRAMEAGFDGYITKPFSVATLVDDIQAILDGVKKAD